MKLIAVIVVAMAAFFLCWGILTLLTARYEQGRQRVEQRIRTLAPKDQRDEDKDVVKRVRFSNLPWMHRLMARLAFAGRISADLQKAGMRGAPAVYVLASAVGALTGFYVGHFIFDALIGGLVAAAILGSAPFFYISRRKNKRMMAFERQLPDALDLIARALRAGHTLPGGMRMVADEFEDPIGPEFRQTLEEINYGISPDKALDHLLERISCPDLGFFVVSVNIQRETGGNLAEIISNIASLVRERFKLLGQVRVLSAEGRLSAMVLIALPFAIAGVIYAVNPEYMSVMAEEKMGRMMIWGSLGMMAMGVVVIRRMIAIKV